MATSDATIKSYGGNKVMKKFIFNSQFEVIAETQEDAYQDLIRFIYLAEQSKFDQDISHFGTEFIEQREL